MLFGDFRDAMNYELGYYRNCITRKEAPLQVEDAFRYLKDELTKLVNQLEKDVLTQVASAQLERKNIRNPRPTRRPTEPLPVATNQSPFLETSHESL